MALRDWLLRESAIARALAQRLAPERKLHYIPGTESAMLVHGPGATDLLAAAHGADGNSAVFACLRALSEGYTEAPLRVYRETAPGERAPQPAHPLQALLNRPNPFMSPLEVWAWVQWAKHLDGNAFLRKIRAGNKRTGNVVELWPVSPTRVELRSEGGAYISAYRYTFAPGQWVDIPPENMVHLRLGIDDRDHRKGLGPIKRLLRAICTDDRAAAWTDRLLGNYAMPGLIISSDQELTQEQADAIKQRAQALYGGDNLGAVGVFGKGASASALGFSPEQMVLPDLRDQPESRIAAALRVPAIVAGLDVGLKRGTFANFREAREMFTETTLVGLWAQDAAKVNAQLVPDFTSDPRIVVVHDLTDVRAFQEDEDAKYKRLKEGVGGPFVTVNEARADIGLTPLPPETGDVLFVPVQVVTTPIKPPAEPAPTSAPAVAPASPEPTPIRGAAARDDWDGKADAPPVRITARDVGQAREWVASLDLPELEAALNGHSANGNGRAN